MTDIEICTEMLGVEPTFIGTIEDGLYTWDTGDMIRMQWTDHTKMVGWLDKSNRDNFILCHYTGRPLRD